jgi:hypothetical protein
MATKEFLRNLRKKHHLGEFRVGHKAFKHTKHSHGMAKKRHSRKKGFLRSSGKSNPMNMIIGVAAVYAINTYAVPRLPVSTTIVAGVEVIGGFMLMNKGGIMGTIGTAAFVAGTLYLMANYLPVIGQAGQATNGLVLY